MQNVLTVAISVFVVLALLGWAGTRDSEEQNNSAVTNGPGNESALRELEESRVRIETQQKEIHGLKTAQASLEARVKTLSRDSAHAKTELALALKEKLEAEAGRQAAEAQVVTLSAKAQRVEAQAAQREKDLALLRDDNSRLRRAVEDAESRVTAHDARIKALEERFEATEKARREAEASAEESRARAEEAEKALADSVEKARQQEEAAKAQETQTYQGNCRPRPVRRILGGLFCR